MSKRTFTVLFCFGALMASAAGQRAPVELFDAVSEVPAPIPPIPAAAMQAGAVAAVRTANGENPDVAGQSYDYALPNDFNLIVSPPDLNTRPDALLWAKNKAAVKPAKKGNGKSDAFLRTQTSDGRLVYWQTGILSLDISGIKGGQRDLSEAANLKLVLPAVSMDAKLTASAGKDANNSDLWQKQVAEVEMQVDAVPKTQVKLTGTGEMSQTYRSPASLGDSGQSPHLIQRETSATTLTATVSPFEKTKVTFGASGVSQTTKDTTAQNKSDRALSAIETQSEKAFVTVSWQPVAWANFEMTAREHNTGILWRSANSKSGSFRASEPRAAMSLNLGDAKLNVSIEKSATDYNTDAFVSYASNSTLTETVPVKPDHALQFKTELTQKIGDASMSAVYTAQRNGAVTEFGFSGTGAQAPVSTAMRRRDEVGVKLDMPLESLGLDDTVVVGDASWRGSEVLDPLTGKYRRASGEAASNVQLRLERSLPAQKLRIGVKGDFSAGQTSYQTKEISQVEASGKLGAFFAYKPDAYEIDLDVDGLLGTPQTTNYFYEGARTVHQFPKVQNTPGEGPTIRLSLKRAF